MPPPIFPRKTLPWTLTTSSLTADQVIGTYTPPADKDFILQAIMVQVVKTTPDNTLENLGELEVQFATVREYGPFRAVNTGPPYGFPLFVGEQKFDGDGSSEFRAVCTPSITASIKWYLTAIGYLKDGGSS